MLENVRVVARAQTLHNYKSKYYKMLVFVVEERFYMGDPLYPMINDDFFALRC